MKICGRVKEGKNFSFLTLIVFFHIVNEKFKNKLYLMMKKYKDQSYFSNPHIHYFSQTIFYLHYACLIRGKKIENEK